MKKDILGATQNIALYIEENWHKLYKSIQLKKIKKNTKIFKKENVANEILIVKIGALRLFRDTEMQCFIADFFFEGDYAFDLNSFLNNSPSLYDIETLEDTHVYIISRDVLPVLAQSHEIFKKIQSNLLYQLSLKFNDRMNSLLVDNAKKRYLRLMDEHPNIMLRVPQYMIAAYLNITPETLSRIRKSFSKKLM